MDKAEAKTVLAQELGSYRLRSYAELVRLIGNEVVYEQAGASGSRYQIEIQVFWDDQLNGNVRVLASVDDGGWRAFIPLTDAFIMSPSGEFV